MIIPRRRRGLKKRLGPGPSWGVVIVSMLAAAGIGALALAELRTGPLAAAMLGVGCYIAFLMMATRLERRLKGKDADVAADTPDTAAAPPETPVTRLTREGRANAHRILSASSSAPDAPRADFLAIAAHAANLCDRLEMAPDRLDSVLRAFTFYLPAVADLAEDRGRLAASAGPGRLAEMDATLARLRTLFAAFERSLIEPDLREIDIDLAVIERSLKEETGSLRQD